MKNKTLGIALEGLPYIGFGFFLTLVIGYWINEYWAIIPLCITGYIIYFFRDPRRYISQDNSLILSAADGKIIGIDEVHESNYFNDRVKRVSIFLSIFDVHINRSPVEGRIEYIQYVPGKFHNALDGKSSIHNEHNFIGIQNHNSKILIKQIAGMIARRIVCDCSTGSTVEQGQRIGLIKFGSRVEMYLPKEMEITVSKGQKVKAGVTIIGRLKG